MAKAYTCDACGTTITNPYEAKMREFYVGVKFDYGTAFPWNVKTPKSKVHLCEECYRSLKTSARNRRAGEQDG